MPDRKDFLMNSRKRPIIGGLTVEEIIRERDRVAQEIKDASHSEMEKLGIVVDALQIQEIEDASGYIGNLAAPHAVAQASQARIAKAQADLEATERELAAQATKAQYERDMAIKQAGYLAETQEAKARADANQALAASLREGNHELIAASTLIENLPALAEAAARGLTGANLTVLNGTQGVNEVVAGLVGQGISILDLLKKSAVAPAPPSANGAAQAALDKIA